MQVRERLADPSIGPEIRALLSVGSRREARDRHAMSVVLATVLSDDANTIDVGAHSGAVLREILRIAPSGRHLAYEPIPELATSLAGEFPTVDVRNAALSDENGESRFVHVDSAPEYSGLREREYHGVADVVKHEITVRTERLDDHLPDDLCPDLIKIDVEGAELPVMMGGIETLRRFRPTLIFEHGAGASERYGTKPKTSGIWSLGSSACGSSISTGPAPIRARASPLCLLHRSGTGSQFPTEKKCARACGEPGGWCAARLACRQ